MGWYAYVKKNVIDLYVLILKSFQDILRELKYLTVCYIICEKHNT